MVDIVIEVEYSVCLCIGKLLELVVIYDGKDGFWCVE